MTMQNRICVHVDRQQRVGVSDVVAMLKGLRREVAVQIVQNSAPQKSTLPQIRELNDIAFLLKGVDTSSPKQTGLYATFND